MSEGTASPEPEQPAASVPTPEPGPPHQAHRDRRFLRITTYIMIGIAFLSLVVALPSFAKELGLAKPESTTSSTVSPATSRSASPGPSASGAPTPSPTGPPTTATPGPGPNPNPPPPNPTTTGTTTTKQATYLTSPRYPFTLNDLETVQFHGNGAPTRGTAGAWGDIIYKDVDHQLNFYGIADTGDVDNPGYDLCHAKAGPAGAIRLDGVSLQHAYCRQEGVVDRNPAIVVYVRVTNNAHISDSTPWVSLEVWFMTKTG
jgi:hypothetical protein